jgi:hypothetical protein
MARTPLTELEEQSERLSKNVTDIIAKLNSIKGIDVDFNIDLELLKTTDKASADIIEKFDKQEKKLKAINNLFGIQTKNVQKLRAAQKANALKLKEAAEKEAIYAGASDEHGKRQLKYWRDQKKLIEDNRDALEKLTAQAKSADRKQMAFDAAEKAGTFATTFSISAMTGGLARLKTQIVDYYNLQNKFRAAYAGMAENIGVTTDGLDRFQDSAAAAYWETLGPLGMSLEQVSQYFSGLRSASQYAGAMAGKSATDWTKMGRALGYTAEELGTVQQSMYAMDVSAKDLESNMLDANSIANKFGLTTKVMQKEVFAAGKKLLDLAGPKYQKQMVTAIANMKALGISAQSLTAFTDTTDSFDKAATNMAKLNTAFGLHINALEVFAEEDPSQRFQKIADQIRAQGIDIQNMGRAEKRMLAENLNLTEQEVNMMGKWVKGNQNVGEMYKQNEQKLVNYDEAMSNLRDTMANMVLFADRMTRSIGKLLAPIFSKIGLVDKLGKNVTNFEGFIESLGDKFDHFFNELGKDPEFKKAIDSIAASIGKFIKLLSDPTFIKNVATMISGIADSVAKFVGFLETGANLLSMGGIGGFIANIVSFMAKWGWMFGPILKSLGSVYELLGGGGGGGGGGGKAGGIVNALKSMYTKVGGVTGAVTKMGTAMKTAGTFAKTAATGISTFGSSALSTIASAGSSVMGTVASAASTIGSGISSAATTAVSTLGGMASSVGGFLGANAGSAAAGGLLGTGAAAAGAGIAGFMAGDLLNEKVLSKFGSATASSLGGYGKMASLQWQFLKDSFRADGGPVSANQPYVVGEQGPEIVVPKSAGTVMPNSSFGGSANITVQVVLDGEIIQERMYKQNLRSIT